MAKGQIGRSRAQLGQHRLSVAAGLIANLGCRSGWYLLERQYLPLRRIYFGRLAQAHGTGFWGIGAPSRVRFQSATRRLLSRLYPRRRRRCPLSAPPSCSWVNGCSDVASSVRAVPPSRRHERTSTARHLPLFFRPKTNPRPSVDDRGFGVEA